MKLWILLIISGVCSGISISGTGSSSSVDVLAALIESYESITDFGISIAYTSSNPPTAVNLTLASTTDFGLVFSTKPGLLSFPLFGEAFGFCYNIPGITAPLNLTAELLSEIFRGVVRRWDDPAVMEVNPQMKESPVEKPIHLIMRGGSSATLLVFNNFMASVDDAFLPYAGSASFPRYINATLTTSDNFGLFAPIYMTPYSLGFVSLSLFYSLQITVNIKTAHLILDNNTYVPSILNAQITMASSSYNKSDYEIHLDNNTGWPITGFTQAILNESPLYSNCTNRRETLKFMNWIIASTSAKQILNKRYYIPLEGLIQREVVDYIRGLKCLNEESLAEQIVEPSNHESIRSVITSVSIALYTILLLLGLFITAFEPTTIGKAYILTLSFGNLLSLLTIITYAMETTALLCTIRTWNLFFSQSIFFGATFCRNWQLMMIQVLVDSGNFNRRVKNNRIFGAGMGIVLAIQFVILIVWTLVDPMELTYSVVDPWERTISRNCASGATRMWYGIQMAFAVVLLGFGVYVVYSTWNMRKKVDDSRMIATSIYLSIIIVVVAFIISDQISEEASSLYLHAGYIISISMTFSFAVFLPKLVRLFKKYLLNEMVSSSNDIRTATHSNH
eukprot:TRINITY_DN13424_c0_g1_i1.p1 TRINITY_DN13424_c0_g1~~TRINITY_DN13424_c0_g1_i1.p1  ORF type:complete len:620 (-),score=108.98 TRINITY_DN13424_c0_g1_i1:60-1919(-)